MPEDLVTPRSIILRFLPVVAWMIVIFVMSDQPTLPNVPGFTTSLISILGHFTVYFVLAILLWWALGSFDLSSRQRVLLALAVATLYGVSDEWHQSFVPGRQPDVLDVLTDAIGASVGLAAIHIASRSRSFGHLVPR